MKKWMALVLAVAMMLSMAACGSETVSSAVQESASEEVSSMVEEESVATAESEVEESATEELVEDPEEIDFSEDRDIPADSSAPNIYGTWELVGAYIDGTYWSVETFEEFHAYTFSDWKIVVSEDQGMYLQVSNTSNTNSSITVDSEGVVAGKTHWILDGEQLVLSPDEDEHYYYEKISDDQTFPELYKQELMDLLSGTWTINSATRTGSFVFSGSDCVMDMNGGVLETSVCADMEKNKIHLNTKVANMNIHQELDYTYENGTLSLTYSGDVLTKQ